MHVMRGAEKAKLAAWGRAGHRQKVGRQGRRERPEARQAGSDAHAAKAVGERDRKRAK